MARNHPKRRDPADMVSAPTIVKRMQLLGSSMRLLGSIGVCKVSHYRRAPSPRRFGATRPALARRPYGLESGQRFDAPILIGGSVPFDIMCWELGRGECWRRGQ